MTIMVYAAVAAAAVALVAAHPPPSSPFFALAQYAFPALDA
jgi:hypothetical protein